MRIQGLRILQKGNKKALCWWKYRKNNFDVDIAHFHHPNAYKQKNAVKFWWTVTTSRRSAKNLCGIFLFIFQRNQRPLKKMNNYYEKVHTNAKCFLELTRNSHFFFSSCELLQIDMCIWAYETVQPVGIIGLKRTAHRWFALRNVARGAKQFWFKLQGARSISWLTHRVARNAGIYENTAKYAY